MHDEKMETNITIKMPHSLTLALSLFPLPTKYFLLSKEIVYVQKYEGIIIRCVKPVIVQKQYIDF
jgi:hypothetical protein